MLCEIFQYGLMRERAAMSRTIYGTIFNTRIAKTHKYTQFNLFLNGVLIIKTDTITTGTQTSFL